MAEHRFAVVQQHCINPWHMADVDQRRHDVEMRIGTVERAALRKSAELCAASLGTQAVLLDHSLCAVKTFPPDEQHAGALCDLVKAVPDGAAQCSAAQQKGARRAVQLGTGYFYPCHAELVEGIVPFERDGTVLAYVLIGPVILAPVDPLLTNRIIERVSSFCIPEEVTRKKMGYIPVVEAERLKRTLNLLGELVSMPLGEHDVAAEAPDTAAAQEELLATPPFAPLHSPRHRKVRSSSPLKQRLVLAKSRLAGASEIRQDICDLISTKAAWDFSADIARAAALETIAALWRTALQQDGRATRIAPRTSTVSELLRAKTFADVIDRANYIIRRMGRDAGALPPASKRALRQVRKYVHGSLAENLSSAKVAREVGIEQGELDGMLRGYFDITFRQYLTMERLTLARRLLRESNLTATEIAATTGFSDQSNFTKTFEKFEGITPTQYRMRSIRVKSLTSGHKRGSEPRKP